MSRARIIYQSEALYVSNGNATGLAGATGIQLHRIQTANYNFNIRRQDINQFGVLAAIGREIIDAPTVALDFSYYVTNAYNENKMGFVTDGSSTAISGFLSKVTDEKNYYLVIAPEGADAATYALGRNIVGIGNGFITSYSTEGRVGGLPTASINVEALNIQFNPTGSVVNPAVNPVNGATIGGAATIPTATTGLAGQVTALRPGDITVSIVASDAGIIGIGSDISNAHIQSYRLEAALARDPLQQLGTRFAFSREIRFPLTVNATIEANIGDLTTGNLADILCNDKSYDITVTLTRPSCVGVGAAGVIYELLGAKLDSQNFSNSIGPNATVTLNFSTQIGGPSDTSRGFFISGTIAN